MSAARLPPTDPAAAADAVGAAPAGATALIVDDERDIRELIALSLVRIGLDTHAAANLEEARQLLATYDFDVCLTDMRLPDGNGLELVRHVQETRPALPIAVITAHGNMEAAVEAMKGGAFDFVSKPVDVARLRAIVTQAVGTFARGTVTASEAGNTDGSTIGATAGGQAPGTASERVGGRVRAASGPAPGGLEALCGQHAPAAPEDTLRGGERLVGRSAPIRELKRLIAKVARTNAPVWITGESGTGKELVARLIHENGPRASAPFVAVNCGAIPSELVESELFGHRKGSFTGAVADGEGLFRRAEGGTLFLDEVAELPLHMQVKLLRAIQERSVRPVGASEEVAVDARVLSASHKDLAAEVDAGRFRHDLYYRLNVISIRSPSLRERPDDVAALARHVLERAADGDRPPPVLDRAAIARLERYRFPGNVRELENLLERAVAMTDGDVIGVDDLLLRDDDFPHAPGDGATCGTGDRDTDERQRFIDALDAARWNRKAAAESVGLTYRQFRYRLARLDIRGPGGR